MGAGTPRAASPAHEPQPSLEPPYTESSVAIISIYQIRNVEYF
jgi:hypothetical protein